MTERELLCSGISRIIWGYVFLHFNFNLGTVNLLPLFAAYLLFDSGLHRLRAEHRDLKLLEPVAVGLGAFYLMDWVLICVGSSLAELAPICSMVAGIMSLYFHFQLLTDLAELAEKYQPEEAATAGSLRRLRSFQTLLLTALDLPVWKALLPEDWLLYVVLVLGILGIGTAIAIIAHLHTLKTDLRQAET